MPEISRPEIQPIISSARKPSTYPFLKGTQKSAATIVDARALETFKYQMEEVAGKIAEFKNNPNANPDALKEYNTFISNARNKAISAGIPSEICTNIMNHHGVLSHWESTLKNKTLNNNKEAAQAQNHQEQQQAFFAIQQAATNQAHSFWENNYAFDWMNSSKEEILNHLNNLPHIKAEEYKQIGEITKNMSPEERNLFLHEYFSKTHEKNQQEIKNAQLEYEEARLRGDKEGMLRAQIREKEAIAQEKANQTYMAAIQKGASHEKAARLATKVYQENIKDCKQIAYKLVDGAQNSQEANSSLTPATKLSDCQEIVNIENKNTEKLSQEQLSGKANATEMLAAQLAAKTLTDSLKTCTITGDDSKTLSSNTPNPPKLSLKSQDLLASLKDAPDESASISDKQNLSDSSGKTTSIPDEMQDLLANLQGAPGETTAITSSNSSEPVAPPLIPSEESHSTVPSVDNNNSTSQPKLTAHIGEVSTPVLPITPKESAKNDLTTLIKAVNANNSQGMC